MKVNIVNKQSKEFVPIELSIKLESIQEARLMFHIVNHANLKDLFVYKDADDYWMDDFNNDIAKSVDGLDAMEKAISDRGIEI